MGIYLAQIQRQIIFLQIISGKKWKNRIRLFLCAFFYSGGGRDLRRRESSWCLVCVAQQAAMDSTGVGFHAGVADSLRAHGNCAVAGLGETLHPFILCGYFSLYGTAGFSSACKARRWPSRIFACCGWRSWRPFFFLPVFIARRRCFWFPVFFGWALLLFLIFLSGILIQGWFKYLCANDVYCGLNYCDCTKQIENRYQRLILRPFVVVLLSQLLAR